MKVLAYLLITCTLFLNSLPGRAMDMQTHKKEACCHEMSKSSSRKPLPQDNCDPGKCNRMLNCSILNFVNTESLLILPLIPTFKEKEIVTYRIGNFSDYSPANWRPPSV